MIPTKNNIMVYCGIDEFVKLITNGENDNIEYYLKKDFQWCVTDTIDYSRDNHVSFGPIEHRKSYSLKTAQHLQSFFPGSEIVGVGKKCYPLL
jgi:hypothetical protein